jgi:DNA-binding protein H-NS
MQQVGITVAELMGRKEGEAAPAAAPLAKYKNPETGVTWSGRGRVPLDCRQEPRGFPRMNAHLSRLAENSGIRFTP